MRISSHNNKNTYPSLFFFFLTTSRILAHCNINNHPSFRFGFFFGLFFGGEVLGVVSIYHSFQILCGLGSVFDWLGLCVWGDALQPFPECIFYVARQTFLFGELVMPQRPKFNTSLCYQKTTPQQIQVPTARFAVDFQRFLYFNVVLFYHKNMACLLTYFGNILSNVVNSVPFKN